jgi:hypothetical protein
MGMAEKHGHGRQISRSGMAELMVGAGQRVVVVGGIEADGRLAHASVVSTSGDTTTPAGDGTSIGGDALDIGD